MAIAEDQLKFITNKVKELGTVHAVNKLYSTDSPIDIWARELAINLFQKEVINGKTN